jgi:hypothetical protein
MVLLRAAAGYRIITAGVPGVTATDAFAGQPQTASDTVGFYGFARILRTGRRITAIIA